MTISPYLLFKALTDNSKYPIRLARHCEALFKITFNKRSCQGELGLAILSTSTSLVEFSSKLMEVAESVHAYATSKEEGTFEKLWMDASSALALTYDLRECLDLSRVYPNTFSQKYLISTASALTITSLNKTWKNFILLCWVAKAAKRSEAMAEYMGKLNGKISVKDGKTGHISCETAYRHLLVTTAKNTSYTFLGVCLVLKNLKIVPVSMRVVLVLKVGALFGSIFQSYYQKQLTPGKIPEET